MSFKQAERADIDGPVTVTRNIAGNLVIMVEHGGVSRSIVVSDYNAARVAGTLAVMLGVEKFGDLGKVKM